MSIQDKIENLAERYKLLEIYVFGSRAHEIESLLDGKKVETTHDGSDLDVAVRISHPQEHNASARVELSSELEDIFEVSRVDLIVLNEADPFLCLEVIKGWLLFVRDPDDQARYELYVMRKAGDLLPFKKERVKAILNEGAR